MGRFGLAILSSMLVAVAAVQAQNANSSERMVRAFQHYCIDADPEQARAELTATLGRPHPTIDSIQSAGTVHTTVSDIWEEQGDLHTRLSFRIVETDRVPHSCRVQTAWAEKANMIRTLSAIVVPTEVTTRVERGSEITRWTTRLRDVPVVVELRVPTYKDEPGRFLTLFMNREEMQKYFTLQDLETHRPADHR